MTDPEARLDAAIAVLSRTGAVGNAALSQRVLAATGYSFGDNQTVLEKLHVEPQ